MTKRDVRSKETHDKIIRSAVRLFARQGYHKTTITDLAQDIGLTSGAIFHHFATKEAILYAVTDWLERGMHRYSAISDTAQCGSLAVIDDVVRLMCNHFRRSPEATICLAALATEFAGSSHPMENRLKQVYEVFVESLARIFQNHSSVADPRAVAIAFIGSVQGIAVQGLLRNGERSIDELAMGFLSILKEW